MLSCASVQNSKEKNYKEKNYKKLYQDCVRDYNQVIDQDEECAEELGKCLEAIEVNQDVLDSIKSKPSTAKVKWMWFGIGAGVGSLVVTGIALSFILGSKR